MLRNSRHFPNAGDPSNPANLPDGVKVLSSGKRSEEQIASILKSMEEDPLQRFTQAVFLGQGFSTLNKSVDTTAARIIKATKTTAFLLLNPASNTLGLTTDNTILNAVTIDDTDLTGTDYFTDAITVSGTLDVHVFFKYSGLKASNNFRVWAQAQNPANDEWADTQNIFDTATEATGTNHYETIGSYGVASKLRFRLDRYDAVGTGDLITATIAVTLKQNVGDLDIATGLSRTVFLGNDGVTSGNGYPLLDGESIMLAMESGTELYAISQIAAGTDLRVWQLEG